MALTLDYINLIVHSDASITDMVSFHGDLRDVEASMFGILYPVIHSYKQLPIGGGAFIPGIIFLNGWTLDFPAGNFEVKGGQIDVTINPVDDCYVKVTQAGAYAVTSIGSTGLTPADISAVADAVRSELATELAAIEYQQKIVKNKRAITVDKKIVVYDDDNTTPILEKQLTDKDGGAIADLASGVLAQEGKSSV